MFRSNGQSVDRWTSRASRGHVVRGAARRIPRSASSHAGDCLVHPAPNATARPSSEWNCWALIRWSLRGPKGRSYLGGRETRRNAHRAPGACCVEVLVTSLQDLRSVNRIRVFPLTQTLFPCSAGDLRPAGRGGSPHHRRRRPRPRATFSAAGDRPLPPPERAEGPRRGGGKGWGSALTFRAASLPRLAQRGLPHASTSVSAARRSRRAPALRSRVRAPAERSSR